MNRIELCDARLNTEEGRRLFAYNDASGKRITLRPNGNLTIGVGINLEYGLLPEEVDFIFQNRLKKTDARLRVYAWYKLLDEPRGSVFLDVAFNVGVSGLLHFPHCILATSIKNYEEAAVQLLDSEAARKYPARYKKLAEILRSGVP